MEENNGDDQLYIPQVVDDRKPKIGMEFASLEEAFSFYNQYARDAKVGAIYSMTEQNVIDDPERCLISRHSRLSYKASVLIDNASLTNEGTCFLDEQFDYIDRKIKEINSRTFSNESQRKKITDQVPGIIDPSEVRTKGCRKRIKSSKENSISKTRLCRGCGRRGVSHDKRNCSNLNDGSSVDNLRHNDDNTDEDFESLAGSNNMKTTGMRFDD